MTSLPRPLAIRVEHARGFVLRPFQGLLEPAIVRAFHRLYYSSGSKTWSNTYWFGTQTQKCPLDLWIYQEILHEVRPAAIVETGTASGGSALFLAALCDLLGTGEIVTVDIEDRPRPSHPRVTYLSGSSTAPEIVSRVKELVGDRGPVLVILDSDHSQAHVRDELAAYASLVTSGSYLIVEDSNINGHPALTEFGPGPMEAIDEFLATSSDFEIDRTREKFLLTFNPRGYLRRR
jgi:cephalosporin hydroxylase